jgi:hypothetical protein
MTDRAYDLPNLTPFQFLSAVMHASDVEMPHRIQAAQILLHQTHPAHWYDDAESTHYQLSGLPVKQ